MESGTEPKLTRLGCAADNPFIHPSRQMHAPSREDHQGLEQVTDARQTMAMCDVCLGANEARIEAGVQAGAVAEVEGQTRARTAGRHSAAQGAR